MRRAPGPKIIFITGTDTGVGKTLLTGLLLWHLRQTDVPVRAMKPFCSGGREDARLLHRLQDGELTLDQINPFHFNEPVAPLVAARKHGRRIPLGAVIESIRKIQNGSRASILLVEGAGGLFAPLGESAKHLAGKNALFGNTLESKHSQKQKRKAVEVKPHCCAVYTAADIITALQCRVVVVAGNRLGTINHSLLTIGALNSIGASGLSLVLSDQAPAIGSSTAVGRSVSSDAAVATNQRILSELLTPIPVVALPFLGANCCQPANIKKLHHNLKTDLARILVAT